MPGQRRQRRGLPASPPADAHSLDAGTSTPGQTDNQVVNQIAAMLGGVLDLLTRLRPPQARQALKTALDGLPVAQRRQLWQAIEAQPDNPAMRCLAIGTKAFKDVASLYSEDMEAYGRTLQQTEQEAETLKEREGKRRKARSFVERDKMIVALRDEELPNGKLRSFGEVCLQIMRTPEWRLNEDGEPITPAAVRSAYLAEKKRQRSRRN